MSNVDRYVNQSNETFNVYLAIRQKYGVYNLVIILVDLKSDTYTVIEVRLNRLARRFYTEMYTENKVQVFKMINSHYYMTDVDFDEDMV